MKSRIVLSLFSAALVSTSLAPASAQTIKSYWQEEDEEEVITIPGDSIATPFARLPTLSGAGPVTIAFEGISQYDTAGFGRNFIPPDTMGAVGTTQYVSLLNGGFGVFDKSTGAVLKKVSDVQFWAEAGQTGTNGVPRVFYNANANRWIAIAFGADTKDIQIAISDTDDALGGWKSTKFEGFPGLGFGAIADYPTLAIDRNAVYIGTNDFAPDEAGGPNLYRGGTMNVIPVADLFGAGAPSVANLRQFNTPYPGTGEDRGYAPQGVNSQAMDGTGTVVAASLYYYDSIAYDVNNLTPTDASGATLGPIQYLGERPYTSPSPGRQPDLVPDTDVDPSAGPLSNRRVIDTLDERISSSVYEANGKIYFVHTVDPTGDLGDYARVHYVVLDAETRAILDEGDIGEGAFDYYQGAIAVNALGDVVISYNRSGYDPEEGRISVMARMFRTYADGTLHQIGDELKLKESLVDDYHNGSLYGQVAEGRQRWGDYAQVSLDPTNPTGFYLIGEFAREYNLPEFGHPSGTGGSRWSTWIVGLDIAAVPEPATWAMMISGFGFIGGALRRRRAETLAA